MVSCEETRQGNIGKPCARAILTWIIGPAIVSSIPLRWQEGPEKLRGSEAYHRLSHAPKKWPCRTLMSNVWAAVSNLDPRAAILIVLRELSITKIQIIHFIGCSWTSPHTWLINRHKPSILWYPYLFVPAPGQYCKELPKILGTKILSLWTVFWIFLDVEKADADSIWFHCVYIYIYNICIPLIYANYKIYIYRQL